MAEELRVDAFLVVPPAGSRHWSGARVPVCANEGKHLRGLQYSNALNVAVEAKPMLTPDRANVGLCRQCRPDVGFTLVGHSVPLGSCRGFLFFFRLPQIVFLFVFLSL